MLQARVELLLDAKAHLERQWTDGVDHEGTNRVVNGRAGDVLAEGMPVLNAFALAHVDRKEGAAGVPIADRHAQPALSTDHQAL